MDFTAPFASFSLTLVPEPFLSKGRKMKSELRKLPRGPLSSIEYFGLMVWQREIL